MRSSAVVVIVAVEVETLSASVSASDADANASAAVAVARSSIAFFAFVFFFSRCLFSLPTLEIQDRVSGSSEERAECSCARSMEKRVNKKEKTR